MNITFFLLYCMLVTISPGPANIVIFSTVQNIGVKKAVEFCYGAVLAFVITIIGGIAFFSWVLFGKLLKSFLENHQKFANIVMSLFLVYCAYMISGIQVL